MSVEVMKQALDALERIGMKDWVERKEYAITALRQAIEQAEKQKAVGWQPIATAPTDNKRPLYLARFHNNELMDLDFDGAWEYWQESWEMSHINGYCWVSSNGIEEPTHWAYQDKPLPLTTPPQREWVSLTDAEVLKLHNGVTKAGLDVMLFARMIEATLREKNGG